MTSQNSSTAQDTTSPQFVKEGNEITCTVGRSGTLRALGYSFDKKRVSACLDFKDGVVPSARDTVILASSSGRKRFIGQCPEEYHLPLEQTLIDLDDFIRLSSATHASKTEKATLKPMSEDEKRKAEELLYDPAMLEKFMTDIERLGSVGEDTNKLYLLLAGTSRLSDSPINTTIKGESSGGKNHRAESVLDFLPPEAVIKLSGVSPRALFHTTTSLRHKVILIAERPGSEAGDYSIRTMQSEKEISFWVVQKSDTGGMETVEKRVEGPAAFIETTTEAHLHAENETRNFEIYIDESERQTERIFQAQNQRYTEPLTTEERQYVLMRWQNAQRLLQTLPVLIPYAAKIPFPSKPLRVRRDRPRFMALIEASALLHQYQRTRRDYKGSPCIEASLDDYRLARELAVPILRQVLRGATPKCVQLVEEAEKSGDIELTYADLERALKWNRNTVRKYTNEALDLGCLEMTDPGGKGQGKTKKFAFGKSIKDVEIPLPTAEELENIL